MQTIFVSVHTNISDLMRRVHETGTVVIRFKGGFDANGNQGWHMTFLPGSN